MSAPVSYTKITLSYPVYAADFDPYNRGYLVVGGGGGEGRSGVGNKITLLDVSSRASISNVAELELSRDEDCVMSLGSLATKEGLVTFAGINSSRADQAAGKNEHLRSFLIRYPDKKRSGQSNAPSDTQSQEKDEGKIAPLGRASLFRPSRGEKNETYQRKLRLSPARPRDSGNKRIAAIATSLAPEGEIVVFDATTPSPNSADVIHRINLPKGAEAADLDIAEPSEGKFLLAYCTDYEVHLSNIAYDFSKQKSANEAPSTRRVYSTPHPDVFETAPRPKFRALRFLTPRHVLLLSNLPNRTGAELLILQLFPAGPGAIVLRKRLPRRIKVAVGLDVCALDADSSTGARQIVIGVAGQDVSIEVLVIDYTGHKSDVMSKFRSVSTFRDVHPFQMTSITIASFHSPIGQTQSKTENQSGNQPKATEARTQYLRLASTSMGNTIVVDTFPLTPVTSTQSRTRYILSSARAQRIQKVATIGLASLIVLVMAILLQSFLTHQGDIAPMSRYLDSVIPGAGEWIDGFAQRHNEVIGKIQKPPHSANEIAEAIVPDTVREAGAQVRELLRRRRDGESDAEKAVILRSSPDSEELSAEVHPDLEEFVKKETSQWTTLNGEEEKTASPGRTPLKKWEELSAQTQEWWKKKLEKAGAWVASEGETVLQGVFFSEWAGFVGEAVGDAIRG